MDVSKHAVTLTTQEKEAFEWYIRDQAMINNNTKRYISVNQAVETLAKDFVKMVILPEMQRQNGKYPIQ